MSSQKTVNEISLNSILDAFARHKLAIVLSTVLVFAGAATYAFTQHNQYRAEVLISLEPAAAQDYLKPIDGQQPINVQDRLWLIRENLYHPAVLDEVVQEFHLLTDQQTPPTGLAKFISQAEAWTKQTMQSAGISLGPEPSEEEKREKQLELLKTKIQIQVEAADAFSVGLEGSDRQQITNATNRLAELLVQHTSRTSEQRAGSAAGFLEAEAERVRQEMEQQQTRIQNYQSTISDQLPARLDSNLKQLGTLQDQLLAKKDLIANDQAHRAAVTEEMKQLEDQGILQPAAMELSPTQAHLNELRAHLKELLTRYTPQHPEVKATQAEIANLEKSNNSADPPKERSEPSPSRLRYMQLKAEQQEIDRKMESEQKEVQSLNSTIAEYDRKVQQAPQHEQQLASLTRDYDATRTQYQALLDKQNQAQIEDRLLKENTQSSLFRVVRPAQFPVEPYAPKRGRILLIGLTAGLFLGFGVALLRESQDTSFKTVEEFRGLCNLPVLAAIPVLPEKRAAVRRPGRSLTITSTNGPLSAAVIQAVTLSDPRSVEAEQYGFLAMQVRQLLGEQSCKVVALTSAAGGEGKTITAINLSVMLARTRPERVLLMECDLRKPRVHEYLGIRPVRGLGDLLRQPEQPLEPCLHKVGPLTVLTGDSAFPNPLETLCSDNLHKLFGRLRREFQYIVVDLPPILPIADSRLVADLADGVVLVVRAQQTRRALFQHALERFNAPNVLGVVLNGVEIQRSSYAYAYKYYAREYLGQGAHSPKRVA